MSLLLSPTPVYEHCLSFHVVPKPLPPHLSFPRHNHNHGWLFYTRFHSSTSFPPPPRASILHFHSSSWLPRTSPRTISADCWEHYRKLQQLIAENSTENCSSWLSRTVSWTAAADCREQQQLIVEDWSGEHWGQQQLIAVMHQAQAQRPQISRKRLRKLSQCSFNSPSFIKFTFNPLRAAIHLMNKSRQLIKIGVPNVS